MKIEIGRYYLDSLKQYHHIVTFEGNDYIDHFGSSYSINGRVYGSEANEYESPYNLVSEIYMYPLKERKELYEKVLRESSIERQLMHLTEEYSEMFIQLSHIVRGRTKDTKELILEMGDMLIMLEEMRYAFGVTEKDLEVARAIKFAKFEHKILHPEEYTN